jgi:nicotinate-nucleotide adenylyltransferase
MAPRRLGIMGGTFDPIHCGHLEAASAVETLLGLTGLLVVPSNVPPHRPLPAASSYHRFAMVSLAVAGRPGLSTSDLRCAAWHTERSASEKQDCREFGTLRWGR